ncbi:hypothetical protein B0A50_02954 [Salinomyces thailandicus]|uniref:Uncharacterized protein n=1 Tax=Salinomyces thailandicus TaxID=706561 RepID=A0A4U0U1F5_9PEZI|nr:hypothetical protein B0A50_02954 [Salinomyces thailandica]
MTDAAVACIQENTFIISRTLVQESCKTVATHTLLHSDGTAFAPTASFYTSVATGLTSQAASSGVEDTAKKTSSERVVSTTTGPTGAFFTTHNLEPTASPSEGGTSAN